MEQHLPDEILSEILTPSLSVSDTDFSDTSPNSPFASYSGHSASAFLLVSKSWLRVSTPLLYNVVVLRSKAQAAALAAALKLNPDLGRFIKKLRLEGGLGASMHPILKGTLSVTDLVLTMDIWSSDSTSGLCRGLSLINPRRVILRHSGGKARTNKATTDLTEIVLKCLPEWSNLAVCDIGVYGHLKTFADSLARSKTIHTLLLPGTAFTRYTLPPLCCAQSLKVVQFKSVMGSIAMQYKTEVDADPRLCKLIKYADKSTCDESTLPVLVSSLNPFVRLMESASQETRDDIWRRILSFAMHTDESELFDSVYGTPAPSLLPLLLVSKKFYTLALPYFFQCLIIPDSAAAVESLRQQLISIPALGSSIRRIYLPIYVGFPEDISSILSCADRLEVVKPFAPIRCHNMDRSEVRGKMCCDSFMAMVQTSGETLRTLSAHIYKSPTVLSPTLFSSFKVLRSLSLSAAGLIFQVNPPLDVKYALATLEELHIDSCDPSLFLVLTCMDLDALWHLSVANIAPEHIDVLESLFQKHGRKLTTLRLSSNISAAVNIFSSCPELATLSIDCGSEIHDRNTIELFSFKTQHLHLAKILITYPGYLIHQISKDHEPRWDSFFQEFDKDTFPGLREIQVSWCVWPLNEREIAKSVWVPRAEMLLSRGINLLDKTGKRWIPRLKLKGVGVRK
ncbi:hypothetical protein C8J57DRAFT_1338947 [Mycena rebaudengoi]|nr:hypothetical protein C8J57DRAFT_1338947 [Mycena rebaudengoi]